MLTLRPTCKLSMLGEIRGVSGLCVMISACQLIRTENEGVKEGIMESGVIQ